MTKEEMYNKINEPVKITGWESFLEWLEFSYIGLIPFWIWKGYGVKWCGIKYIPTEIRWFLQRQFKGYSDNQLWGLDYYLGKHIVKVLRAFNGKKLNGCPCEYTEKNGKKVSMKVAMNNWKKDIKDMIDGFDFLTNKDEKFDEILAKCNKDYKKAGKEYDKQCASAKTKAQKLIEHFNDLWD